MRERNVAALIVSENARTRYLTGYQRYFTATHVPPVHAVLLTLHDGPILLVPRHIGLASGDHHAERLILLDFGEAARIDAIGRIIRDLGAARETIAVEMGFLSHAFLEKLKAHLPAATITDADPVLQAATAAKFPDEIVLLRESARIVDIGVAAAVAACRAGVTELDVAAEASAVMLRSGAEFINHMTIRSGPHAYANYPFPTARRLETGDCVQIDIGCVYGGYVSDTNRTKIVGRASTEQMELLDVGQRMLEAGIASVAPGIAASAVWRAAFDVADKAGMKDRVILPFVGHGIGLGLHELPFFNAAATTVLQEGMVVALEPGVYAPAIGCSRPEDMLLVTADGAELLTHYPRDHDLNRSAA
jgi:Xaa-Pro aminopeptidase